MAQPTIKLRDGVLSVTVWENETEEGKTFYSTTATRSYKDGEEWKETTSFNTDDLLKVSSLLNQAYIEIVNLRNNKD